MTFHRFNIAEFIRKFAYYYNLKFQQMNANLRKQHWEMKDDHVLDVPEEEVSCCSLQMESVSLSDDDKKELIAQHNEPPDQDPVSETEYMLATSKWRDYMQPN